jgi:trimeric autotransporter adhesin
MMRLLTRHQLLRPALPRLSRALPRAAAALALLLTAACAGGSDVTGSPGGGSGSTGNGNQNSVPARIDFSVNVIGLGAVGASENITALVRDAAGNLLPAAGVTWSSADITVADISGSGATATITARAPGRTSVRATSGSVSQELTVNVSVVRAITLPPSAQVRAASSIILTPLLDADAGASTALRWESADATIATVANGVVTGVQPGATVIRAIAVGDPRISASVQLSVGAARSVVIDQAASELFVGDERQFAVAVDVNDGESRAVEWSTSHPTVATVTSSGRVIAVGPGSAIIRVQSAAFAGVRDSATVTVRIPRSVTVSPTTVSMGPGQTRQLLAQVQIEAGLPTAVSWRSGNPAVAMVASNGLVTGVAQGTTTITAVSVADTTRRSSASVTIVPMVRDVEVQPTAATVGIGENRQLVASVSVDAGASTEVEWRSSNASVATVSAAGIVRGVSAGATIITAVSVSDTTRRSTSMITVRNVPLVSVTPTSLTMLVGGSADLSATVQADPGVSTAVTWRTSNAAVASVSTSGRVNALASGTATVTAVSVADTTRRASSTVTVNAPPAVNAVTVSPSTSSLQTGQTVQLVPTVQVSGGASQAVTYRSANSAVATVTTGGLVSAVGAGSTTITVIATADTTRRATATVAVSAAPSVNDVSVSPSAAALTPGQSVQLVPTVSVSGGASTAVTYRSDNPAVASVTFSGTVNALSTGSATITVTATADPSRTATATITVTTAPTQLAASWTSARLGGALHEDVVSFDAIDASNAFAVNSKGDVYRLSGSTWTLATSGSTHGTQFLAVSATTTANAVAVGTNGAVVRFNGSSWTRMSSSTQQTLNGVHLENATTGFAVGSNGLVLRFDGSSWTGMSTGTGRTLYGIWTAGSTGFAVGALGELLRWNGTAWSRVSSGTTETLYGVHGISASSAVAVGAFGTVLRWNGSNWTRVNSGSVTADFYNVAGSSANNNRYYLASDDGLYSLNNNSLTMTGTPYAPRLFGASIDGSGNVWTSGQRGSVMRLAGSTWTTVSLAPDLIDVWTTAANNAWAVGEFGFVYRWNGSAWSRQTTPTTATLNTVWGANANEAFIGGDNGTMLRWNGTTWSSIAFPSTGNVYGLWGTSATNLYAVTSNGDVLRYNGTSWSTVTTTSSPLWVVYGSSASDVYAAGDDGVMLRFNGTSWSRVTMPASGLIAGVWASSSANVYSVGTSSSGTAGESFRFNGTSWSSVPMPTSSALTSLWGASANDVYATVATGAILRWNGSVWSSMSTGTTDQLWAVSGAPSGVGGGFAVGYNSTVAAATGGSGMVMAGLRTTGTAGGGNLDPKAGAQQVRGALPSGKERRLRR